MYHECAIRSLNLNVNPTISHGFHVVRKLYIMISKETI